MLPLHLPSSRSYLYHARARNRKRARPGPVSPFDSHAPLPFMQQKCNPAGGPIDRNGDGGDDVGGIDEERGLVRVKDWISRWAEFPRTFSTFNTTRYTKRIKWLSSSNALPPLRENPLNVSLQVSKQMGRILREFVLLCDTFYYKHRISYFDAEIGTTGYCRDSLARMEAAIRHKSRSRPTFTCRCSPLYLLSCL